MSSPRSYLSAVLSVLALALLLLIAFYNTGRPMLRGAELEAALAVRAANSRVMFAIDASLALAALVLALWARRRNERSHRGALIVAAVACLPIALILAMRIRSLVF